MSFIKRKLEQRYANEFLQSCIEDEYLSSADDIDMDQVDTGKEEQD